MDNAKYEEAEFLPAPHPERVCKIDFLPGAERRPQKAIGFGIKTILETENGLKLKPHKTIVLEIKQGDELASFDLPASFARAIGRRLGEFADAIEA